MNGAAKTDDRKNSIRFSNKALNGEKLVKKDELNSVEKTQVVYLEVIRCVVF